VTEYQLDVAFKSTVPEAPRLTELLKVAVGAMLSTTVTVMFAVEELEEPSAAVAVTTLAPKSSHVNEVFEYVTVGWPHASVAVAVLAGRVAEPEASK
jgi:hypothetical protein